MALGDKFPVIMGKEKAVPSGVATLGEDGKLAKAQRPTPTEAGSADLILSNLSNRQRALENLGAGVRPNLLINPFFQVNQRGQTSYSGTYGVYTVDGWLLNNNETATVNVLSNGVQIVAGTVTAQFRQYLESLPDGVYTLSFLFADGSLGYAVYEKSGTAYTRKDYAGSDVWGLGMQDTSGKPTAYMYVQSGMSAAPVASKLESGEGQTLAYQDDTGVWQLLPQPESDYATQMLKCQRYYQIYSTADARPSKAVDCRPVMRTDPAQGTIVVDDTTYYYNTAEL